ncbi:AraC family transcriptional regulator [Chitinispirillales bacterium ANBcel5]|uniref:helix-turn-helix domain-containing protein n=1 Tax=Cellulosispirillum alkaliphilum TaxID=3039283 RepID=UPI002A50727C|nr:AraC family transcriptional regulator [Chitinispirillales bacterium ANBcel5]
MNTKTAAFKKTLLLSAVILSSATLLSIILFSFRPAEEKITYTLFPADPLKVSTVEDSHDGGNSRVVSFKMDSLLHFQYTLKGGFNYPYAGIKIRLGETDTCGINFSRYDSIALSITSNSTDAVRVFLKEYHATIFDPNDPTSYIYKEIEYVPGTGQNERVFSLQDFTSPAWWVIDKELEKEIFHPLQRVSYIEILNGLIRSDEDTIGVVVSNIELRGKDTKFSSLITGLQLFIWIGAIFWTLPLLIRAYRRELKFKKRHLSMLQSSTRVELSDSENESASRIFQYLGQNFTNPELTLEKVARGAGVARNRVSEEIRSQLNTTFKGYLNDLRLNEASRLLTHTQRRITEIALAVGFNNISHFNRLFKERYKQSPREYRTSTQKQQNSEEVRDCTCSKT